MPKLYGFFCDVNYSVAIKKEERDAIYSSMFEFMKTSARGSRFRLKERKDRYTFGLNKGKLSIHFTVLKHLHIGIILRKKPTNPELKTFNDMANRFIGFANNIENRSVKNFEPNAMVEGKLDKSVISTFTKNETLVDLGSKLKMNFKPYGLALQSKVTGAKTLTMLTSEAKGENLTFSIAKRLKETPWDMVNEEYADINKRLTPILHALGVRFTDD